MSYSVSGSSISLTRGDTFKAQIELTDSNGNPYVPVDGDVIRFAAKMNYSDAEPCLVKNIPIDTMKLIFDPEDTKNLKFATYVYDIQITQASGEVDTFLMGKLKITEEVD